MKYSLKNILIVHTLMLGILFHNTIMQGSALLLNALELTEALVQSNPTLPTSTTTLNNLESYYQNQTATPDMNGQIINIFPALKQGVDYTIATNSLNNAQDNMNLRNILYSSRQNPRFYEGKLQHSITQMTMGYEYNGGSLVLAINNAANFLSNIPTVAWSQGVYYRVDQVNDAKQDYIYTIISFTDNNDIAYAYIVLQTQSTLQNSNIGLNTTTCQGKYCINYPNFADGRCIKITAPVQAPTKFLALLHKYQNQVASSSANSTIVATYPALQSNDYTVTTNSLNNVSGSTNLRNIRYSTTTNPASYGNPLHNAVTQMTMGYAYNGGSFIMNITNAAKFLENIPVSVWNSGVYYRIDQVNDASGQYIYTIVTFTDNQDNIYAYMVLQTQGILMSSNLGLNTLTCTNAYCINYPSLVSRQCIQFTAPALSNAPTFVPAVTASLLTVEGLRRYYAGKTGRSLMTNNVVNIVDSTSGSGFGLYNNMSSIPNSSTMTSANGGYQSNYSNPIQLMAPQKSLSAAAPIIIAMNNGTQAKSSNTVLQFTSIPSQIQDSFYVTVDQVSDILGQYVYVICCLTDQNGNVYSYGVVQSTVFFTDADISLQGPCSSSSNVCAQNVNLQTGQSVKIGLLTLPNILSYYQNRTAQSADNNTVIYAHPSLKVTADYFININGSLNRNIGSVSPSSMTNPAQFNVLQAIENTPLYQVMLKYDVGINNAWLKFYITNISQLFSDIAASAWQQGIYYRLDQIQDASGQYMYAISSFTDNLSNVYAYIVVQTQTMFMGINEIGFNVNNCTHEPGLCSNYPAASGQSIKLIANGAVTYKSAQAAYTASQVANQANWVANIDNLYGQLSDKGQYWFLTKTQCKNRIGMILKQGYNPLSYNVYAGPPYAGDLVDCYNNPNCNPTANGWGG